MEEGDNMVEVEYRGCSPTAAAYVMNAHQKEIEER